MRAVWSRPIPADAKARGAESYRNSSAAAWVNFTSVPDSCFHSQPRSIANLRPAPYSAGVPRKGELIFLNVDPAVLDGLGDFKQLARGFFRIGEWSVGGELHRLDSTVMCEFVGWCWPRIVQIGTRVLKNYDMNLRAK